MRLRKIGCLMLAIAMVLVMIPLPANAAAEPAELQDLQLIYDVAVSEATVGSDSNTFPGDDSYTGGLKQVILTVKLLNLSETPFKLYQLKPAIEYDASILYPSEVEGDYINETPGGNEVEIGDDISVAGKALLGIHAVFQTNLLYSADGGRIKIAPEIEFTGNPGTRPIAGSELNGRADQYIEKVNDVSSNLIVPASNDATLTKEIPVCKISFMLKNGESLKSDTFSIGSPTQVYQYQNGGGEYWQDSAIKNIKFTGDMPLPSDTTAPTLSGVSVSGATHNSATLKLTSDEAGTAYYKVVKTSDATVAPTAEALKSSGTNGGAVTANAEATISLTGLEASTAYTVYVTVFDDAGNGATVETKTVTTTAAPAQKCTITWSANGGTPAPSTSEVNQGVAIGTLPSPTKTGYELDGWYTGSGADGAWGTKISADTLAPSEATVTYYAKWTPATLTFNTQPSGVTGTVGKAITATAALTLNGDATGDLVAFALNLPAGSTLPNGLSFATDTGVFSGTPTATCEITGATITATGNNGGTVTSDPFNITISDKEFSPALTIGTQPQDAEETVGESVEFTVGNLAEDNPGAATVTSGVTYQWEVKIGDAAWTPIEGATAAAYSINAVTLAMNGNQYHCVLTYTKDEDHLAKTTTSADATLTVKKPALTGTVSIDGTAKVGEELTANTESLDATKGDLGVLTYQWQSSSNGSDYTNIDKATNSTYTPSAEDKGKTLKVVVSAANYDGTLTSAATSAVVAGTPVIDQFAVRAGNKKLTLSWELDAKGSTLTGYELTINEVLSTDGITISNMADLATIAYDDDNTKTATATIKTDATTVEIGGLKNGTKYTVTLTAQSSDAGNSATVTKDATPKMPSDDDGMGGPVVSIYTVTYDAGEHGTVTQKTERVVSGNFPNGVEVTANAGFVFKGWSTDGKTVIDLKGYKVSEDVTLIAVYGIEGLAFDKELVESYISGYPDGTFGPEISMTRAEVAAVMARTLTVKMDSEKTYSLNYSDTDPNAWYASYVGFLSELGVLSGYPDGTFRPDAQISREEFVTMVIKVDGLVNGATSFPDVPETNALKEYILASAEKGYVTGYPDGTFAPMKSLTRAEAVTIMNKVLERAKTDGEMKFTDVEAEHWAYDDIITASTNRA